MSERHKVTLQSVVEFISNSGVIEQEALIAKAREVYRFAESIGATVRKCGLVYECIEASIIIDGHWVDVSADLLGYWWVGDDQGYKNSRLALVYYAHTLERQIARKQLSLASVNAALDRVGIGANEENHDGR